MNKESKLNLNAGSYAISHCDSDKTYNGLEVHKMLCDAYIAGNNDAFDDEAYRKAYYDGYNKCNRDWIYSQEDERIRKEILSFCQNRADNYPNDPKYANIGNWISWLERQGEQKQLYIRFGEIPTDEKSKIYRGEIEIGTENGVSVYPAFKTDEGDIVLGLSLPITKTTLYTQQHLIEYDNRPCYLVNGDYIGKDTDGQPLINNVSIIKKIDNYRVKEENQDEQEKDILEDAILDGNEDGLIAETIRYKNEKQGEKKSADKVEPKFKVGDKIRRKTPSSFDKDMQVARIEKDYYVCNHIGKFSSEVVPFSKQSSYELIEQKPAWSEEDEQHVNSLLKRLEGMCKKGATYTATRFPVSQDIDWIKSLKERKGGKI